ncbi:MAG: glycine cleavage system protein H [Candidatus Bathyarchaeia archaeon]|jgi:glycine cleavage system H protein|nr:glycine cleavage system protein H [Candidatus Bathyarchaeota archaeon A05DMB-4]MDH7594663.1 glycine cleavage system protein H [Candidatus Bathyarchaeota archaeon]
MSEINVTEDNENYTIRYWKYKVIIPKNLLYSKESHFWVKQQGDIVEIGYTDPFQQLMGDIAAINLPPIGSTTEEMGEIESMKAATEIISPVEGTFIEVNKELEKDPYPLNEKPYSTWLFRVKPSNWEESKKYLQSSAEYLKEVLKIIEAQEAKRKK